MASNTLDSTLRTRFLHRRYLASEELLSGIFVYPIAHDYDFYGILQVKQAVVHHAVAIHLRTRGAFVSPIKGSSIGEFAKNYETIFLRRNDFSCCDNAVSHLIRNQIKNKIIDLKALDDNMI